MRRVATADEGSTNSERRKYLFFVGVTPIVATIVLIVGVHYGWFFRGFSAEEVQELERDWSQVEVWGSSPPLDYDVVARTAEITAAVKKVQLPQELLGESEEALLSRQELPPDVAELLVRFESHLEACELGPMGPWTSIAALRRIGELELRLEDLNAERMGQLLALIRKVQRNSSLPTQIAAWSSLGTKALERCQKDPTLIPDMVGVEAPRFEELFYGISRYFVEADRVLSRRGKRPQRNPEFPRRVMRRGMADIAHELHRRRTDPDAFIERPEVEPLGKYRSWVASKLGRHEDLAGQIENAVSFTSAHDSWVTFVNSWDEVLSD